MSAGAGGRVIGRSGELSAIDAAQQMLIPVLGVPAAGQSPSKAGRDTIASGWAGLPSLRTYIFTLLCLAGRRHGQPELALDDALVQPAVALGRDDITWQPLVGTRPSPPAQQLPLGATARVDPGSERRKSSRRPVREPRKR